MLSSLLKRKAKLADFSRTVRVYGVTLAVTMSFVTGLKQLET